jgi:lysozyme family protein
MKTMYPTLVSVPTHILSAISRLLEREGLISDDPADKGRLTNYGITLATLKEWCPGATASDLKNITKTEAILIYANMFWTEDINEIYKVSALLGENVFDVGVNSGPFDAVCMFQHFLGVKADGSVGPITAGALVRFLDRWGVKNAMNFFCDFRIRYYIGLCETDKSQIKFLCGWFNRVTKIRYQA